MKVPNELDEYIKKMENSDIAIPYNGKYGKSLIQEWKRNVDIGLMNLDLYKFYIKGLKNIIEDL